MKTIIYTLLSLLFSTVSIGQALDCLNNLTVGLAEDEVIQIFAVDFLVNHSVDPGEDVFSEKYVLSLDGGQGSAIVDVDETGVFSYLVVNTETSQTCEGTLIVESCTDCEGPISHNSSDLLAVCTSSITILYPDKNTIELADIDAGTNSPNGGLILSISSDSQYEFTPDDPGFTPQTSVQISEDDVCNTVIVRLFAADSEGNTNVCWTEILVGSENADCGFSSTKCFAECENFVPLDPYTIKWPAPYGSTDLESYVLSCDGLQVKESPTPLTCGDAFMALPTWCDTECGLVGFSLEEVNFEGQTSTCKNVKRIWTVIDWCTFDPFVPANTGDQLGIVEDLSTAECLDCTSSHIGNVYARYLDVKEDGFYRFEQTIEIEEENLVDRTDDLSETDVPVNITLMNGVSDNYPFSLHINDQALSVSENGFLFIPESALNENENTISLSTLDGNNDFLNGVSTLDMVLIVQHLLGLRELETHQVIAADLNKSGSISVAGDILKMRSLIIGLDTEIPGEDWFLVEENHDFNNFNRDNFENDFSQFEFNKSDLNMDEGLNFNIYKYGDVNDSYSFTRSDDQAELTFENIQLEKGSEHTIPFTLLSNDTDGFIGAQFSIVLHDASILNVEHDYGKDLQFHIVDNTIRFSILGQRNESIDELEIKLQLVSDKHQEASQAFELEDQFIREFITTEGTVHDIKLMSTEHYIPSNSPLTNRLKVYPNPAIDQINVTVPSDAIGELLKIYNTQGQLEHAVMIDTENVYLSAAALNLNGLKIIHVDGVPSQTIFIE